MFKTVTLTAYKTRFHTTCQLKHIKLLIHRFWVETNVHYCLTSIKSGKCPMCLFYKPSVRFHRMRIICLWCLIQHLFQKGMHEHEKENDHARTQRSLPFWWFLATLNENCLKIWNPKSEMAKLPYKHQHQCWCSCLFVMFVYFTTVSRSNQSYSRAIFNGYFWICARNNGRKKKFGKKYDPV